MPIHFICPLCRKEIIVDNQFGGQSRPCEGCGQTVTLPIASTPTTAVASPVGVAMPPLPGLGSQSGAPGPVSNRADSGRTIVFLVIGTMMAFSACVCGGFLWSILAPVWKESRANARRLQATKNLKQILLALHSYETTYGVFPPAYVADAQGKPKYSWRVLILPYLEDPQASAAYAKFDRDKAWDSPENQVASKMVVSIFKSPHDKTGNCSFMTLRGPRTLFPNGNPMPLNRVTDDTATTISVVELGGRMNGWAEPVDIDMRELDLPVGEEPGQIPGPDFELMVDGKAGFHMGMADGSIKFMPLLPTSVYGSHPNTRFHYMSTISGHEPIPPP